jgi:ABC-type polysaccharide/polyol phosphate export permease
VTLIVWRAFLRRARLEAASQLTPFFIQLAAIGMGLLSQGYLGRLVDSADNPVLGEYSGHFAGYLICGIALLDLQNALVGGLGRKIRESQLFGWLEVMLATPTPPSLLLSGLVLPDLFGSLLRLMLYAVAGVLLFGLDASAVNVPGVLVMLAGAALAFAAFALVGAAVTMTLRRADPLGLLLAAAAMIAGGVFYPRGILPGWLQAIGSWVPIAPALDGLRAAVVQGRGPLELGEPLLRLGAITLVVGLIGALWFARALARARVDGSLTAA